MHIPNPLIRLCLSCAMLGLMVVACGDSTKRERREWAPEANHTSNGTENNAPPTSSNSPTGNNPPTDSNSPTSSNPPTGSNPPTTDEPDEPIETFCDMSVCHINCTLVTQLQEDADACLQGCYERAIPEVATRMRELESCLEGCSDQGDLDANIDCLVSQCGEELKVHYVCAGYLDLDEFGWLGPGNCAQFHGCDLECVATWETCEQGCRRNENCLSECRMELFLCRYDYCAHMLTESVGQRLAMPLGVCRILNECDAPDSDVSTLHECERTFCAHELAACLADK
jgi:hypothetical protein